MHRSIICRVLHLNLKVSRCKMREGRGQEAHLIMACRANLSQASILKMPSLSRERRLMSAKRLTVRFSLMGTVFTKVVNERPLPRVNAITLVLGSSACAVTCTSGTCTMPRHSLSAMQKCSITAQQSKDDSMSAHGNMGAHAITFENSHMAFTGLLCRRKSAWTP